MRHCRKNNIEYVTESRFFVSRMFGLLLCRTIRPFHVCMMLFWAYVAASTGLALLGGFQGVLALISWRVRRSYTGVQGRACPYPAVTVQVPLYNEEAVAERVIDAVMALDYPHDLLEVQILDDSTDSTSARVAQAVEQYQRQGLQISHVQRPHRAGFKAGALQEGLRAAGGTFVAVFDADFLPHPDFLSRLLPYFSSPDVGMVQARWSFLNREESWLTCVQAMGLETHFTVEQQGRYAAGWPLSFNGTAGIWRVSCIEDAGGWQPDTLTEDLDLSYRAQWAGWRFCYVDACEVPSELPSTLPAVFSQYHRWAKGSAEVLRKLGGSLWSAPLRRGAKIASALHLAAPLLYPMLVVLAVLHPAMAFLPLPSWAGWLWVSGGMGLAGFVLAHATTIRKRHRDRFLSRLMRVLPFMTWIVGMSWNNARGVLAGLAGYRSDFVRTPKRGSGLLPAYRVHYSPVAETVLAVYAGFGLVALGVQGMWWSLPFQTILFAGFAGVVFTSRKQTGS